MKLNFWKKDQTLEKSEGQYPIIVQEIHKEFMGSSEESLQIALNYIKIHENILNTDDSKNNRLSKIGFTSVPQVVSSKKMKNKIELTKKEIKLINKYREEYPDYKFITESNVKAICEKYNLLQGSIGIFKGFVPEKNLEDIEKFKNKYNLSIWKTENTDKILDMSDYYISGSNKDYQHFYHKSDKNKLVGIFQTNKDSPGFYSDGVVNGEYYNCTGVDGYLTEYGLQICAPLKDMNTKGLTLKKGFKLQKHIPDPVVLQPVPGGFLIVTAWGDESEDELVK